MTGTSAARAVATVSADARDVWIVIVFSLSVKEMQAGLKVVSSTAEYLVRALAWAVNAAYAREPTPAIY